MSDNLKAKTTSAFGWVLGGQLSGQVVGFVISLVLARLLTPEEFGLASLVLVVNLIGQVFIDAGISTGLVRKAKISNKELSSFFYLNIAMGFTMMMVVLFSSTYISAIFENSELEVLINLSSIQFFISSFGLMPSVLMKRDINFKFLSKMEFGINLGSGVITVILALLGFGVYSLILRSIISGLLSVSLLWKNTKWRPSLVFSFDSIKSTLSYSAGILGLGIINRVSSNFSSFLISKYFSMAALGIYNRAEGTRGLVLKNLGPVIDKVFFPVLSKIQDDDVRLQSYFLKAMQFVSLITVFFMAILYMFAQPLILYFYGEQWVTAAPILQLLSIAGLVLPASNLSLNLFMIKGNSKFLMTYELIKNVLAAIVMYFAIAYSMNYFLYSLIGVAYLFFFTNAILTYKIYSLSLKAQLLSFGSKLIPGLILVSICELFVFPDNVSLIYVVTIGPLFSILYFGSSFLIDQELYFLLLNYLKPKYLKVKKKFKLF